MIIHFPSVVFPMEMELLLLLSHILIYIALFFVKVLEGKPPTCNIFSQQVFLCLCLFSDYALLISFRHLVCGLIFTFMQYAFNLFSHNAPILSNGYNEEEMKLVKETRKIWVSILSNIILFSLLHYLMSVWLLYGSALVYCLSVF